MLGSEWIALDSIDDWAGTPQNEAGRKVVYFIQQWIKGKQAFTYRTSGSTGPPKSIVFSRAQLEASAGITINRLELQPGMKALVCLDTDFVAGSLMLVRGLVGEMDLIIRPPSSNPLEDIGEPIDFAAFVPLQVSTLLANSRDALNRISTVIIGGTALSPSLSKELASMPGKYFATYGMTETLTHVALQRLNGPDRQSTFHLLPGFSAETDKRGCIIIRAKHLGEATVLTNDIAEFISPTEFRILGRIDNIINSGGYKIHTDRVEEAIYQELQNLGLSQRFFLFGKPDDQLGERVCLLMESDPVGEIAQAAVIKGLKGLLQKYELPKEIFYLKRFKETPTQKIDRKATIQLLG